MRRAKLLRQPEEESRTLVLSELAEKAGKSPEWEEAVFFRHRCDEEWFEELISSSGLERKKITPSRLRKLIVMALQKRNEESR